jgi:hypothetical protein
MRSSWRQHLLKSGDSAGGCAHLCDVPRRYPADFTSRVLRSSSAFFASASYCKESSYEFALWQCSLSKPGRATCACQPWKACLRLFAHLARAIQACYFVQQRHLPINGAPGGSPCTHLTRAYMLHGAAFTPERGVSQRSRDRVLRLATLPPADGLVSSSPHCTSAASDYSRGFQLEYSRPRLIRTEGKRSACNDELLERKTSAATEGVLPRRDQGCL